MPMCQSISLICELKPNWVEQMSSSLEKIMETMGSWFTPGEIGFVPALA
ncbi:MAG: hypothetical protein HOD22_00830 [Candidatus Pacebacteria bacterium]|jgi:hypothetical protein|nr:hypothetical protein [Candidatus Paceibacterota bacterium]MBT4680613.1 hypothetical protein [Candidatus Paceibacterota bacterium]